MQPKFTSDKPAEQPKNESPPPEAKPNPFMSGNTIVADNPFVKASAPPNNAFSQAAVNSSSVQKPNMFAAGGNGTNAFMKPLA